MANASKALLMAGGILISIIIIGVAVYMYNGILKAKAQEDENQYAKTILKMNSQIEVFTGASKIYGSDVLSLCNLLEDYKVKYPTDEGYPNVEMQVKFGNKIGWDEVKNKTLSKDELKEKFDNLNQTLENLGEGNFTTQSGYIVGKIKKFAGMNDDEILQYLAQLWREGKISQEDASSVNLYATLGGIYHYRQVKSQIVEFKNTKFKCNMVVYNPNNKVISYIEYETI